MITEIIVRDKNLTETEIFRKNDAMSKSRFYSLLREESVRGRRLPRCSVFVLPLV